MYPNVWLIAAFMIGWSIGMVTCRLVVDLMEVAKK